MAPVKITAWWKAVTCPTLFPTLEANGVNEETMKDQPEPGDARGHGGDGKRHMTPLRTAMATGLLVMTGAFLVAGLKMGAKSSIAEGVDGKHPLKARLFQADQGWQAAVGTVHGIDPSTRFTIVDMTKPQPGVLNGEPGTPRGTATVLEVRETVSILAVTWKNGDIPSRLDELWVYVSTAATP
jgi:hypothetical protein